jgi:hypothetical protein
MARTLGLEQLVLLRDLCRTLTPARDDLLQHG